MHMKVYISGKIGEETPSPETLAKFKAAEELLAARGYDVFNPTTSGLGAHAESLAKANGTTFYEEILLLDLEQLKHCQAIYMLDDWEESDGANVEMDYAMATHKRMFWQDYEDAQLFLNDDNEKLEDVWLPIE